MNKTGPIVVIEDDFEDQQMLTQIFLELGVKNRIYYFETGETALKFLINTPIKPFVILSDIVMPRLDGLKLREQIHNNEDLMLKCIPYLFFTTYADQDYVIDAYSNFIQGFFVKPHNYEKYKSVIKLILDYWHECEAPEYVK